MVDGERMVSVTLSAEAWSHVCDALALGLEGVELGYELRFGGSQLRDALAKIEGTTSAYARTLEIARPDLEFFRGSKRDPHVHSLRGGGHFCADCGEDME